MRKIININNQWKYKKLDIEDNDYIDVDLPHCYNGIDGQDGGNDYYRGKVQYIKILNLVELLESKFYYLEFNGVNSSADIIVNDNTIFHHDGGYSTFRVNITNYLRKGNNTVCVIVDNSPTDYIYPQNADFTFYGGIYRDVNLIIADDIHFDLDFYGGSGIKITPTIKEKDAEIEIITYLNKIVSNTIVKLTILDSDDKVISSKEKKIDSKDLYFDLSIKNVHLWNGRIDPYLYKVKAEVIKDDEVIDNISSNFGCRSFKIDPDNGFILNGKSYPLRGVCRHQDRPLVGNAISKENQDEDMKLILELGATTIRLAHYQHDQYFYDLCDKYGLIVWTEIPYISTHLEKGFDNSISLMKELLIQNYNHPSIVVWGLSNEITMKGNSTPSIIENHKALNDLCHSFDKTRLTAIAAISFCKDDDPYLSISDLVSWNLYFGWYGGTCDMNGPFLDKFHMLHPNTPVGLSEYGCEALNWHSSTPHPGDYSEEYQAYYHEELIKQLYTRKYLWATHVWNMFDFGSDRRDEGGESGLNHKGLVSFDRKYKKDSFYAYKAWLSNEPFIHICSKRYIDRVEDKTFVIIYSNLPEVKLYVNDKLVEVKKCEDHFFHFTIDNINESKIKAVANNLVDEAIIRKVDSQNQSYIYLHGGKAKNWFE